jgi:hypothetical protein
MIANRHTCFGSGNAALSQFKKALVYLSLTLGITSGVGVTFAIAAPNPVTKSADIIKAEAASTTATRNYLPNGVYLYGQSQKPEQMGSAYLVFEVTNNRVVGAFYMPRSSFDCVYGNFQAEELALTVVDSYERTTHPYAIALRQDYAVARAGNNPTEQAQIGLDGLQPVATISDNDRRILGICKANAQNLSR